MVIVGVTHRQFFAPKPGEPSCSRAARPWVADRLCFIDPRGVSDHMPPDRLATPIDYPPRRPRRRAGILLLAW